MCIVTTLYACVYVTTLHCMHVCVCVHTCVHACAQSSYQLFLHCPTRTTVHGVGLSVRLKSVIQVLFIHDPHPQNDHVQSIIAGNSQ